MSCSPIPCFSTSPASERADHHSIEKHMRLEAQEHEKTIRLLLLGPGSSGKTTILKQIKRIHANDDKSELKARKAIASFVKIAVIDYMKILCEQSIILHAKYNEDTCVEPKHEDLREDLLKLRYPYELNDDICTKIEELWTDSGIQRTLSKRQYFQIHENVAYFFDRLDVIRMPKYVPSFDDYLRFRQRSTGFNQNKIKINISNFGLYTFEFTDVGGQRSERRKWMHCVSEDVNAVLYVIAISDYDLKMFEDHSKNRLVDSLELFQNIMIKGNFFRNKSVLLFFNKYDLFIEKIKTTPITVAFDDFPTDKMDPNNADDAVHFVAGKFLKIFMDAKVELMAPLHVKRTTALDTGNINKIFGDIKLDLVKEKLQSLNLL